MQRGHAKDCWWGGGGDGGTATSVGSRCLIVRRSGMQVVPILGDASMQDGPSIIATVLAIATPYPSREDRSPFSGAL